MKIFKYIFLLTLLSQIAISKSHTQTFPSLDGLPVTYDSYIKLDKNRPIIVLFHQAGWSRGEYKEIAPKLNKLGFNAIAVDLRSGGKINDIVNQTHLKALQAGKPTTYIDALQDMIAALKFARKIVGPKGKVIGWGSSYSAGLILHIAGKYPKMIDAVLAFSPGEYYTKLGKPSDWIAKTSMPYTNPVFITSARSEATRWMHIFKNIKSKNKTAFIPSSAGRHGSRTLWSIFKDSNEYWKALIAFLTKIDP